MGSPLGVVASRHEIEHRGTRYVGYRVSAGIDEVFLLLATGWTGNSGEWIRISGDDEIAWSYLAEKLPGIGRARGDKEGYTLLFARMGIEVFG